MKEDSVVPEKMPSIVNYRIVFAIIIAATVFHYSLKFVFNLNDDEQDLVTSVAPIISTMIVGIVSLSVAYKYLKDAAWNVFYRSYVFLGIAFFSLVIGEVIYGTYDLIYDIDAYPSIADIFYGLFHTFTILHLITNAKYFSHNTPVVIKIVSGLIMAGIIFSYAFLSLSTVDELGFDFFYGLIFVSFNAIVIGLTVYGVLVFENSVLGKIWLALLIGIAAITVGDIWYYYLEIIGGFDLSHPVNFFWYAGYWIMVYSLICHKKDI